jgi:hypothetical protein
MSQSSLLDEKRIYDILMARLESRHPQAGLLLHGHVHPLGGGKSCSAHIKMSLPMDDAITIDCDINIHYCESQAAAQKIFDFTVLTPGGSGSSFIKLRGFQKLRILGKLSLVGLVDNTVMLFVFDTHGDAFLKHQKTPDSFLGWHAGMADLMLDAYKEAAGQPFQNIKAVRYVEPENGKTWAESVEPPLINPSLNLSKPATAKKAPHSDETEKGHAIEFKSGWLIIVLIGLLASWAYLSKAKNS